ncbi:metal-sulfur cluster assembly factor [Spirochaeta africana]|uniref:Putative metal-sulfur cluster biosynthetic enzyme n=1 Tax=Spirochaeta africana (strain ATCC 700263 / DSM 8902 / Z-7692) TaxID=889378 RepID=U3GJK8_SPIAZ|nr:metal-sulfur cluster assembly factor [Spirochaeta africana]AFG37759.1 putative metal-sulfur cluster biosynthetic enzyme [Spirochaeta africana DSM 8902]
MISKAECLDALREVVDPEIGINIVDVGLVYRVEPKENSIEVDFTLTSPGCPLADTIMADITNSLQQAAGEGVEIVAELVWNPPWSIEFLSEEARLELGYPI